MFIYYRLLHSTSELNSEIQILVTPALLFHEDSAQYTLSPLKIIFYYPNAIRSQGNIWQKDLELTSLMVPQSPSGPTLAPCVVSQPGPSDTLIQRSLGTAQSTLLGFNGYGVRGRGEKHKYRTTVCPHTMPGSASQQEESLIVNWRLGTRWRIMLLWSERSLNQQPLYYKLLSLLSYYIRPRLEEIN